MNFSRLIIIVMSVILTFFLTTLSGAQDPGIADTVRLATITGEIADKAVMPVYVYNDEVLNSIVIPLVIHGAEGWLRFDSVSYIGGRLSDPAVLNQRETYTYGTDFFAVDSVVLFFVNSGENDLPIGSGRLCDIWFTLHFGGEVSIDSSMLSPHGSLLFDNGSKTSFTPQFVPGLVDILCNYMVGDLNEDEYLNVADIVMLQKIYHYDYPLSSYPINDKYGRADVNCDRRIDIRDMNRLTGYIFRDHPAPCTCGTASPPSYNDPGIPDTVWVESMELLTGIPSSICIGIKNDESLGGVALAFEFNGDAVLALEEPPEPVGTERISNLFWNILMHADSVNPDTLTFYAFAYMDALEPGDGAICCPLFMPLSAGTATFNLTSWVHSSPSICATLDDNAGILPTILGGQITVLPYICGDVNHDGQVNVADIVYLINFIFKYGDAPEPVCVGDANGDGEVNVADTVFLVNYIFKDGPPPVADCCPE